MKKFLFPFFLFITIFITSCSQKTSISIIEKPNLDVSSDIRYIKVDTIKGDTIGLRNKIIENMEKVNRYTNYFHINPTNYKAVLTGKVYIDKYDRTYIKRKNKPCKVLLYECKRVGGKIFCKQRAKIITEYQLKNMLKNAFINGNYFLLNKHLYKYKKDCSNVQKKCVVRVVKIKANISINKRKRIYLEEYKADSCKDGILEDFHIIENRLASKIARRIVDDIAPHPRYISIPLVDKPDVIMTSSDKKEFDTIVEMLEDNENPEFIEYKIKNLLKKYPDSQVLKYFLAITLTKQGRYKHAKKILKSINLKEKEELEYYLNRVWSNK